MKNFKTLALFLLFFIGFIIPSCKDDFPGCNCPESTYFDVEGLEFQFLEDVNSLIYVATDSIAFSDFEGLFVDFLVDYHVNLQPRQDWSFSLMNTANACSCIAKGELGSKTEKLVAMSVTTINDFDADHLAGSEISDLLDYCGGSYDPTPSGMTLEGYLANQLGNNLATEDLILKLNKAPVSTGPFQAKIIMELSTGEKYEATSPAIYFK